MCTINKDHVMYGVTDKNFVLLGHFMPFQPPERAFAPEIWSVTNRIFCHFGPFFALLPP